MITNRMKAVSLIATLALGCVLVPNGFAGQPESPAANLKFSHPRNITNPYLPLASLKQDILEGTEGGKRTRDELLISHNSDSAKTTSAPHSTGAPTAAEVTSWVADYQAAHPGRGGKDWDINRKSAAEIAADPKLKRLLGLCGPDQRPVIPALAWEYGGKDHQWINPTASALVCCVYIPVSPNSEHWKYDKATDHVTADVYVKFLDQNPGKNETGAAQVMSCLGHRSNIEILVDTASLNDGKAAGLNLAEATTDLYLILPDGSRVLMYQGK